MTIKKRSVRFLDMENGSPERVEHSRPVLIPVAMEIVFYRGVYFRKGDIVSIPWEGILYFAQIRGFLSDQYGGKAVFLTWVFPTRASPPGRFDPDTYVFGLSEQYPVHLINITHVMRCPEDPYYHWNSDPVHRPDLQKGFAFTRKGYRMVDLPFEDFDSSDND